MHPHLSITAAFQGVKMKVIYMGTPGIAIKPLESLVNHPRINIPLVICQPDKPKGRGKKLAPPPVKEFAETAGIEVYQPLTLKNNNELVQKISHIEPDFLVVVAYGRILPNNILNSAKYAPINVHFSLLPKYRGAAPVNWAVVNGEKHTGVTTMLMSEGLDEGDILLQKSVEIDLKNSVELSEELSELGAELIVKTLLNFENIQPRPQNHRLSSYAPVINKKDGLVDWSESASQIERQIRGFQPWPSAFSYINGKMIKLFKAEVVENIESSHKAGSIIEINKESFTVKCGKDCLRVLELQMEGKKRTTAKNFLSGNKLEKGMRLGQ
ncbi:Methionyl-tRNA formyltransferase [Flexistipes sinusarabici DSM 4947]|uniref:Methionyl-tRNA formyltransferase n=2 Tax=Flexistipes sinusarabici TaxID=2352 RepID=F8E7N8_FLESM|nr:Methionyl-tRNA formyltransferase [Flexistipes sinusarabici DSM 4947]